jgi:hypothetical protein
MSQQYLHIELSNDYTLDFKIHNTPIADLWLERMELRHSYAIDHPDRFYGFDSQEQEIARAEKMIQDCIVTINDYQPIIEREFTSVYDQDCLNYLHNIFERYHGLLNQQKTIWWLRAPQSARTALTHWRRFYTLQNACGLRSIPSLCSRIVCIDVSPKVVQCLTDRYKSCPGIEARAFERLCVCVLCLCLCVCVF